MMRFLEEVGVRHLNKKFTLLAYDRNRQGAHRVAPSNMKHHWTTHSCTFKTCPACAPPHGSGHEFRHAYDHAYWHHLASLDAGTRHRQPPSAQGGAGRTDLSAPAGSLASLPGRHTRPGGASPGSPLPALQDIPSLRHAPAGLLGAGVLAGGP